MLATQPRVIQVGDAIQLFSNGFPGLGSLNSLFLIEHKVGAKFVPVTETITHNSGEVELPDGYRLKVTLRDML